MSKTIEEAAVYVRHVCALFIPGVDPGEHVAHAVEPDALVDWCSDEHRLLIEEGRRQVDRQRAELERVQARGQLLFTTAAALLTVFLSQTRGLAGLVVVILWVVGLLLLVAGLLGAAALMSVRARFGGIDAALLSHQAAGSVEAGLAAAYSRAVRTGENTAATRITVFRDAVALVLIGAVLQTVIWLYTLSV
jgi:hypothetical protein